MTVLQLLDDYARAVGDGGLSAGAALFQDAPPATGDSSVDAAVAAALTGPADRAHCRA